MTTNLCRGEADADALDDLLEVWAPDVVAAQELGYAQTEVLEHRYGFGVCKPQHDGEGHGLVAAVPMTVEVLDLPDRPALSGSADTAAGEVDIIGLHLLNPVDGWLRRAPIRGSQISAVAAHLATAVPGRRVVLGDLNATPLWPAYRRVRVGLTDVVSDWCRLVGVAPEPTWAPRVGGRPRLRIDHVLASGLRARRVHVATVAGSDHRAVIVDLDV